MTQISFFLKILLPDFDFWELEIPKWFKVNLPRQSPEMSDDLRDFEEQIRLQNSQTVDVEVKTRVDPDGTVMEWDEQRKGWFPKVSYYFCIYVWSQNNDWSLLPIFFASNY